MSKRCIGTERHLPFPPPQRFCAAVPLLWLEGCGRGRRWRDVLVRKNSAGTASVRRTRAVLDWSSFLHRPRTCAAVGRRHHPVSLRPHVVRETAKGKTYQSWLQLLLQQSDVGHRVCSLSGCQLIVCIKPLFKKKIDVELYRFG